VTQEPDSANPAKLPGEATFTEARSFQLFMEGLRFLRAYESEPSTDRLRSADAKLTRCVESYPSDALPQFYLGVVKTLTGYPGLEQAARLFTAVSDSGPDSLRLPAKYNLAAVHVEKYSDEDDELADRLLREIEKKLVGSGRPVQARNAALLAQVTSLLAYVVVRRQLEVPLDRNEQIAPAAFELTRQALLVARQDAQDPHIPERVIRDVQADIANVEGILAESEAKLAKDPEERRRKTAEAERSYRQSLAHKRDWIPAMSNLARIYQRLLGQPARAETLWNEVLRVRPGDAYANYMLGDLFEHADPSRPARAFECYWRAASSIEKAADRLKALESQVPTYQRPIDYEPSSRSSTRESGSKD